MQQLAFLLSFFLFFTSLRLPIQYGVWDTSCVFEDKSYVTPHHTAIRTLVVTCYICLWVID
jgi:hypothetical protein